MKVCSSIGDHGSIAQPSCARCSRQHAPSCHSYRGAAFECAADGLPHSPPRHGGIRTLRGRSRFDELVDRQHRGGHRRRYRAFGGRKRKWHPLRREHAADGRSAVHCVGGSNRPYGAAVGRSASIAGHRTPTAHFVGGFCHRIGRRDIRQHSGRPGSLRPERDDRSGGHPDTTARGLLSHRAGPPRGRGLLGGGRRGGGPARHGALGQRHRVFQSRSGAVREPLGAHPSVGRGPIGPAHQSKHGSSRREIFCRLTCARRSLRRRTKHRTSRVHALWSDPIGAPPIHGQIEAGGKSH